MAIFNMQSDLNKKFDLEKKVNRNEDDKISLRASTD